MKYKIVGIEKHIYIALYLNIDADCVNPIYLVEIKLVNAGDLVFLQNERIIQYEELQNR